MTDVYPTFFLTLITRLKPLVEIFPTTQGSTWEMLQNASKIIWSMRAKKVFEQKVWMSFLMLHFLKKRNIFQDIKATHQIMRSRMDNARRLELSRFVRTYLQSKVNCLTLFFHKSNFLERLFECQFLWGLKLQIYTDTMSHGRKIFILWNCLEKII